jgi:hypothetical protein
MTQEDFLRWAANHTPWTPRPIANIPDKWWTDIWEVWSEHGDYFDNLERSISKMGGYIWVSEAALREYAQTLTVEEQVGLFRSLRASAPTLEPIFRPQFERGFPESAAALPAPFTAAELEQLKAEAQRKSRPMDIPY